MDSMGALPLSMFPQAVSTCHAVRLGRDGWYCWHGIIDLDAAEIVFSPQKKSPEASGLSMNKTSFLRLFFRRLEPRLQFVDLLLQSFRKVCAELGEIFANQWHFCKPTVNIYA